MRAQLNFLLSNRIILYSKYNVVLLLVCKNWKMSLTHDKSKISYISPSTLAGQVGLLLSHMVPAARMRSRG